MVQYIYEISNIRKIHLGGKTMAQIPQINNPITAKNYNYSSRQTDPNTEPFDMVKLTGVQGSGSSSASGARSRLEMGNRELIPLQEIGRASCRERVLRLV